MYSDCSIDIEITMISLIIILMTKIMVRLHLKAKGNSLYMFCSSEILGRINNSREAIQNKIISKTPSSICSIFQLEYLKPSSVSTLFIFFLSFYEAWFAFILYSSLLYFSSYYQFYSMLSGTLLGGMRCFIFFGQHLQ